MVKRKICKIYLFRHGQTVFNKNHVFTGWKNSKLTFLGMRQAKLLAKKLKSHKIDIAFHSRLSRSKDTLKEILKFHPECNEIVQDDRIIERSYGSLEGMSHKKFMEKWGRKKFEVYHRSYQTPPPKGESIKTVEKRVLFFIKDLLDIIKKRKVNVAISCHGNSMRPFRRYFEKSTIKQMMSWEMPYDTYFEYSVKV